MAGGLNLRVTTLDPTELARIRALLADNPPVEPVGGTGNYPRMLFHESYVGAQQEWRKDADENKKKIAAEKMKVSTVVVFDPDEEVEFLQDGWKRSPADFMAVDPRIPVGREARKAAAQQAMSKDEEIQMLMRRLAELRGTDAPATEAPVARAARPAVRRKIRKPTRAAKLAAARQAVRPPDPDAEVPTT